MTDDLTALRAVLDEVARRRATVAWRRGWTAGALVAAAVLMAVRLVLLVTAPHGGAFLLLVVAASVGAVAALVVALRGSRTVSTPGQLARLLEERLGGRDEVVVTAVDYATRPEASPVMAARLATAAHRAIGDDAADQVVARDMLTATGRRAAAAGVALAVAVALMLVPIGDALELAAAYLVPSRVTLAVEPGDVRVRAGRAVTIRARVTGSDVLTPAVVAADGAPSLMTPTADGGFELVLPDVTGTFPYHVEAGPARSGRYTVTVIQPARVERIDLDYVYPSALGVAPRREDDGGDIYAPAGTAVTLHITADRPVEGGALVLADGTTVPLDVAGLASTARLTVAADGAYRVTLRDDDGVDMPDDTEYFIRTLLDRPPDVRVVKPAGDKQVTPLEEVVIEARADDDFGVESVELVLQKPGDPPVVVPLAPGAGGLTVNGAHTLYLEDLGVAPGDIVSYFVRARDMGRGKPSAESRSDMYFLEVKAFNDEFVAAQSQAMAAGGQSQGVEDLAAAQKEIVVATWKLDSRGRRANRATAAADIQAIAVAQRAVAERAEKEAGTQRQAATPGGAPRRRRGQATIDTVAADPLGLAIEAMRRASEALDGKRTSAALPHEMEALNQLLRAEADVRRRQVARQQRGGGGGGNRNTPDLSALFDQELRKQQQTNYETPASSETRAETAKDADPLKRLRELARRQEALSREQDDLARTEKALEPEAIKRRLERLTRDQEELRKALEALAREMPSSSQSGSRSERQAAQAGGPPPSPSGSQGPQAPPSPAQGASSGSSGASGQPSASSGNQRPRESEQDAVRNALAEMREATSGLREQDAARASASAGRALEGLRRAEDAMRGSTSADLTRQLGDLRVEARQLAEAQRRLAAEVRRTVEGPTSAATQAAVAEQSRLARRAERLRQRLGGLSAQAREAAGRATLDAAGREMDAGRSADLMRAAADAMAGTSTSPSTPEADASSRTGRAPGSTSSPRDAQAEERAARAARLGDEAASALERVAETLNGARRPASAATARLSEELAGTRRLRDQLEQVEHALEALSAHDQGQRRAEADAARTSSNRDGAAAGGRPSGGSRGDARGTDGELARLQRQLADDMRSAREQVEALGRQSAELRGPSTPEAWQPSVSAPGTEAFKQDFARWESLKQNLLVALEKMERQAADQLRAEEARDRLHAGASDAVPDDYRRLVDKYYRSLAAPRRPGR